MSNREVMQQALEALTESVDLVRNDYQADWRHGIPAREAQLGGKREALEFHEAAITALRAALADPVLNADPLSPTCSNTSGVERTVRPRAWTLQCELDARETTCRAHLWFVDPVNSAWAPLYGQAELDAAVTAERERWTALRRYCGEAGHDEGRCGNAACLRGA